MGMFSLSDVTTFSENEPTYRILKPWWDVFMDYITVVLLMLSIFAGTMQISRDQVVCLPFHDPEVYENRGKATTERPPEAVITKNTMVSLATTTASFMTKAIPESLADGHKIQQPTDLGNIDPSGIKNNLDFQQYVYISQLCYHIALPWFSKYFPYLALFHTVILMVSSNFWFKYPKTSSKIEHFVSILGKCFESQWTTKALSETACEHTEETKKRLSRASTLPKHFSTCSADGIPLETNDTVCRSGVSFTEKPAEGPQMMPVLDKKDNEQAKALFEKVRKLRSHIEDSDLIYKMYVVQTSIKTVKFVLIICYTLTFVAKIEFYHICETDLVYLTGYSKFMCTHNMAFVLKKLLISYIVLIAVYGLVCVYTLFWLFRRSLREYSFEKLREESSFSDIPDVKNDFAFLLHMVDQYDQLYASRFGVFLSEVSEQKLRDVSLNQEWTYEKLRQYVTRNAQDKVELHLFMLSGLPDGVFDFYDVDILKLESIPEVRLTAKVTQLLHLRELHIYHCPIKLDQAAFMFLSERLRIVHVKFTDVAEIPSWVYLLKCLLELYLYGHLSSDSKTIGLESLRDLKNLKILHFKCNMTKIPPNLTDVAGHLVKLVIHNDGAKLIIMNTLKKMTSLTELELHSCQMEKIPHAIFSLTNLQELDMKSNHMQNIEEVVSLQHLKRLVSLKFSHNKIQSIPASINCIKNLESLYLSHNMLESLPVELFDLVKLRNLDISYNSITKIPQQVGMLQNLQYFAITGNKVEVVPAQLFRCLNLRSLCLGYNSISVLSEKIGQLVQLTHLELKVNTLERLPETLRQCHLLRRSGLLVEDHLFESLPADVRDKINHESNG